MRLARIGTRIGSTCHTVFFVLFSCADSMWNPEVNFRFAVPGAAACALFLVWLVIFHARSSNILSREVLLLGILGAAGGLLIFWSTIVSHESQAHLWSPQWTFLAGALPFYLIAIWIWFFSRFEFRLIGFTRMLLMVCVGSAAGHLARKNVYPQFSDNDSPSDSLPPPTMFPR